MKKYTVYHNKNIIEFECSNIRYFESSGTIFFYKEDKTTAIITPTSVLILNN